MSGITITGLDTCLTRLKNAEAQLTSPNSAARAALLNTLGLKAWKEMNDGYKAATSAYKDGGPWYYSVVKDRKGSGTEMSVVAEGMSILFLEFGTGLTRINGPAHREAEQYGFGFRTFSATHQKHLWDTRYLAKYKGSWFNPITGEQMWGNPPAQAWYNARQIIENHDTIQKTAESVFNVFGHTDK